MGSTDSSGPSPALTAALRAAAEGGAVGAALAATGCALAGPGARGAILAGAGAAWALSAASVAWLLWGRARGAKAFWWAFGGGMALRAAGLLALMAWSWGRSGGVAEALLLSYAFGVLAMLLVMELRHLRIT